MKMTTLALTLCLTLALFASLAIADEHSKQTIASEDEWTALIGDSLDGWSTQDKDTFWKLEDGVIIGENANKKESRLWTDAEFGDYELVAEFMTPSKDYDSGIFLRGTTHQCQIGISRSLKKDLTGAIYCPKDGNGSYPQQPDEKIKEAHKLGEWNTLRIVTVGKNIKTYLNGELINDYDGKVYPEKGKIGLQLHSGVHMKMYFKHIKIKSLDSE